MPKLAQFISEFIDLYLADSIRSYDPAKERLIPRKPPDI